MPTTPTAPSSPTREDRPSREERLAAKLRENLRRRKAQARALDADGDTNGGTDASGAAPDGLFKPGASG